MAKVISVRFQYLSYIHKCYGNKMNVWSFNQLSLWKQAMCNWLLRDWKKDLFSFFSPCFCNIPYSIISFQNILYFALCALFFFFFSMLTALFWGRFFQRNRNRGYFITLVRVFKENPLPRAELRQNKSAPVISMGVRLFFILWLLFL